MNTKSVLLAFLFVFLVATLSSVVYAGVCKPTCTLNSPSADFEQEERDAWSNSVTMTHSTSPGCTSGRTITMWYQEPDSSTWVQASIFSNNVTAGFSRLLCLGTTCNINIGMTAYDVADDWKERAKCTSGGDTGYSSPYIYFNITDETIPPNMVQLVPDNGETFYNGESIDFNGTCIDTYWYSIDTFQLWANWTDVWEVNSSVSSYSEGAVQNFSVSGIPAGEWMWNLMCNDTKGNLRWGDNRTLYMVSDSTPPIVEMISPVNDTTDEDANVTFTCEATDANTVHRMSLYGDWGTGWGEKKNQTGSFPQPSDTNVLGTINKISAYNAGGVRGFQIQFDISFIPEDVDIAEINVCLKDRSTLVVIGESVTIDRVDDQSWSFFSYSSSDWNSASLTNETTTVVPEAETDFYVDGNWYCFNNTEQIMEEIAQENGLYTMRMEFTDYSVGTATGVVPFYDPYLYMNSSPYQIWDFADPGEDAEDVRPRLKVSYYSTNDTTAQWIVDDIDNGTYIWTCRATDDAENIGWAEWNYTVTFGSVSDSCACPGINTNWEIDLGDFCWITEPCNIGTGNITWTGTGNITFNTTVNFTRIDPLPAGTRGWLTSIAKIWQLFS